MSGALQAVFQNLRSFIGPPWLATIGDPNEGTSGDNVPYGYYVDNAGNMYVTGTSRGSSDTQTYFYVAKYNSTGVLQWQNTYGASGSAPVGTAITGDSSGNIYVVGAQSGSAGIFYKLDTSGTIVSQIGLSDTEPRGIAITSDGEFVLLFWSYSSSVAIARLNSAATSVVWRFNKNSNQNIQFAYNGIAIAASGNIYAIGKYNFGGAGNQWLIVKYDSSGTVVWSRRSTPYGTGDSGLTGIVIDSSENLYVTGQNGNTPTTRLNKIDSNGDFVWGKTIDTGCQSGTVALDSTGSYLYVSGTRTSAFKGQFICKFDTSGNIQWQRTLQYFAFFQNNQMGGPYAPIRLDSNFMYIALRVALGEYGANEFAIQKLPLDGSKTGTYTLGVFTVTYAASSLTIGDRANSDIGSTDYANATGTLTLPSSSTTRATASYTNSSVTL